MKDHYRIHELAELFGLCTDTLRYYEEKDLLHPVRGDNGYRIYGIQDLCTLNIIRSLRDLGMPLEDIRGYLEGRSVEETLRFLDFEASLLSRRMEELKSAQREAQARRARLMRYSHVEDRRVVLLTAPERPYVFLQEDIILEREIDFLLKKLETKHQSCIKIIGNQCMGAILNEKRFKDGVYNHFSCVFFLTEPEKPHDAALPQGEYASLFYRGPYTAFKRHYRDLLNGISSLDRVADGPPLELYRIDAHDTNFEEEYLTEIQMKVRKSNDREII